MLKLGKSLEKICNFSYLQGLIKAYKNPKSVGISNKSEFNTAKWLVLPLQKKVIMPWNPAIWLAGSPEPRFQTGLNKMIQTG